MKYEAVIGLEVHVQLNTRSKAFCSCPTEFGAEPNLNTCPVCLGLPGSLPVLNERALDCAIKVALALDCKVAERLKFDRKNYFYPDLPKAYQISQYDMPLSYKGYLVIETKEGEKTIGITRAHLEEDAGKLLHEGIKDGSWVDYNRAGVPLLEIVSEPDLRTPEEAYAYLVSLKAILQYLEVSDCDMEKGHLRCDVNISVRPEGEKKLGTKAEIKNLNSFNHVRRALEHEIKRQIEVVASGGKVIQETRLWNPKEEITVSMRRKEEAHDYRYFPEPDLVPFTVSREKVEDMRKTLPELPVERSRRFMKDYGLSRYDAYVLVTEKGLADYYESCVKEGVSPKLASNWIQSELFGFMKARGLALENIKVKPRDLAGLVRLIEGGTISGKIAKDVLPEMLDTGKSADEIVKEKGLVQVSDTGLLERAADEAVSENPKSVADYKAGKKQALGFLVGQVMQKTKGKANPALVNEILRKKLG
ncbi:MAG: Asp-tRNA(Asn)/Glu-tRNA(Gln) amidotransferase subunit GatB [Candidatus Omnitrophica bacterium]|nr:Asp-tRNA(Asn)/Glu-tRNA(Gln) amidotransferase subunit GatB [Candidatus Omnitrophota bacterium]